MARNTFGTILLVLAVSGCDSSGASPLTTDAGSGGTDDAALPASGGVKASGGAGNASGRGSTGGSGGTPGSGGASGNGGAGGSSGVGGVAGKSGTGGRPGAGGTAVSGGAGGMAGVGGASSSTSASRHKAIRIGGSNTAPNGYWEYLPPGYDGSSPAPLIVFWHGIGQNGDGDSELQKAADEGPPRLIRDNKWPDARPFIVLSPQYKGVNGEIAPGRGCPASANVDGFFGWALAHYNVDPKKVFLTGLSCGAIGSWDYLGDHRGAIVAAAVLICGNPGDPATAGSAWQRATCGLGEAAIWSLHGDRDSVVPYAPDRDTMQNLAACPSPPRRTAVFTTLAGADHGIWAPIYDLTGGSGDVYQWMLDNAKK